MKQSVCVLVIDQGLILAVSRKDNFSLFGFPGGEVNTNETLIEAAIRETKEETGIIVSELEKIYAAPCGKYFCTTFFAHKYQGEPTTPKENEGLVRQMSMDEFLTNNAFKKYNTVAIKQWKKKFNRA